MRLIALLSMSTLLIGLAHASGGARHLSLEEAAGQAQFILVVGKERKGEVTKRLEFDDGHKAKQRYRRMRVLEVIKGATGLAEGQSYVIGHDKHEYSLTFVQRGTRLDVLHANTPINHEVEARTRADGTRKIPIYPMLDGSLTEGLEGLPRMILLARYDARYEGFVAVAGDGLIHPRFQAKLKEMAAEGFSKVKAP